MIKELFTATTTPATTADSSVEVDFEQVYKTNLKKEKKVKKDKNRKSQVSMIEAKDLVAGIIENWEKL